MMMLAPLDYDVIRFNAACISAGTALTTPMIMALNEMVIRLKQTGIWAKCKVIYPMIGGSVNSHKLNLKDPRDLDAAFRLAFTGGTHSANGVAWNGTSQWANTFLSPAAVLSLNDASLSYYSRTNTGAADTEIGVYDAGVGGGFYLNINYSGTEYKSINSLESTGATALGTAAQGLFIGSRINSTQEFHKRAAAATTTATKNSLAGALISGNVYLGAVNTLTVGADAFTNKQCAFAHMGNGITTAQMDLLQTIVQNYQTRLGRQV